MSDKLITSVVIVFTSIIGVAIIALLVTKNSTDIFSAGSSGFQQAMCVALSPITGGSCGSGSIPNVTSTITFGDVIG